jgi:hypothetical protein
MNTHNIKQCLRITAAAELMAVAMITAFVALASRAIGSNPNGPPVINDAAMRALTTTTGGASVLPTTRTVPHWWASTLNPHNGVAYGYNIVGADPSTCSGAQCDVTVTVDIIPVNVVVDDMTFYGSNVVAPTLASPVFALNDYVSTPFATALGPYSDEPRFPRGPGGILSQGDAGNQLQLQDATMRAQFNKTGASLYHLRLNPIVHGPVTIVVPAGQGTLLQSERGVVFAALKGQWWAARIQNLNNSLGYVDPTHLAIYLTDTVVLYYGNDPFGDCCTFGFHSAGEVPGETYGLGNHNHYGNGNEPVQTYAWASWLRPGLWALPDGGNQWPLQDISGLSHEIAEWANDPFDNNTVEPWLTPTAPQYGCYNWMETGDPVVAIGFAKGTNTYDQGPNPNGTQSADGYYHPQDEVFLPWFMRLAPNFVSEPTQSPSANIGRYSLMGDLNPFPSFRQPATGCN